MPGRLHGQVAIVTGGSRGIGAAIAHAFAYEGACVAIASRKPEGVAAAVTALEEAVPGARVLGVPCHVGKPEAIQALFESVDEHLGRPTVLVNNAGTNPHFGPMLDVEWPAWDKTFEVNLKGPFACTRAFAQRAFAAGEGGTVINISSITGARASPWQGVYAMTKAALISMTQTLAVEFSGTGLRVNAIAPGLVQTRLASALTSNDDATERIIGRQPIRRIGQPHEIAGLAVFLASAESSYMSGQTIFVDGGYTIA